MTTPNMKSYATAAISPTMTAFADYLIAEVYGGALPADFDEATFRKAVALGGSTRGYFQKSETWKSDDRNYLANVATRKEEKVLARAAKIEADRVKREARETAALAAAEAILAARKAAEVPAEVPAETPKPRAPRDRKAA